MKKDESRKKRYRDKFGYITDNLKNLTLIPKTELEKKGVFYSVQTIIEAIMDIVAMFIKDLGLQVEDDQRNISLFVKKLNLDYELEIELKKAYELRNTLVYHYIGINEESVLNSVNEVIRVVSKWLKIFEKLFVELFNET
ncbi:MAG: HepT-like ribonuclease domain-containing protein [Candidatus Heimdallarchaeaceae archaeon]